MSKYTDDDMFRDRTSEEQIRRREARAQKKASGNAKRQKRARARRNHALGLLRMAIFGILCLAFLFTASNIKTILDLKDESRRTEAALSDKLREKQKLEQELEVVNSDEYVEQQARAELRMIYNGETLYVTKDAEEPDEGSGAKSTAPSIPEETPAAEKSDDAAPKDAAEASMQKGKP
ncbi:MAG: septum formation initiator family protein [Firmicutes bacterium]|nr:septum formation initiator family protein [Bacillota bacterium]